MRDTLRPVRDAAESPNRRAGTPAIGLDGALNCRDLGGLPTLDGRRVRQGRLYRSDSLHRASKRDVETLHRLGVATIIDLRDADEVALNGRGRLALEPITYVNRPLRFNPALDAATDEASSPLVRRYRDYLDESGGAFVAVFDLLAETTTYPAVINCFFGKDRTGVVVALVLAALGVDRTAIVEDYASSARPVASLITRLTEDPSTLMPSREPIRADSTPSPRPWCTSSRNSTGETGVRCPGSSARVSTSRVWTSCASCCSSEAERTT